MNKIFGSMGAFLIAAVNCLPQELPITSQVERTPEGYVVVSIVNTSTQPVTALVAVAQQIPLDKSVRRGMSVRFFDAVENFVHDRPLLRGESTTFRFGGPSPGLSRVRYDADCKAGILADGTTFGDPVWADRLIARRKYLYEHLRSGIEFLQSALQNGLSRSQVMEQAQQTKDAMETTAKDRFDRAAIWTVSDEIRHNLEINTRSDGSVAPDAERIQEVLELFLKRHQLLLSSKPSIGEASP